MNDDDLPATRGDLRRLKTELTTELTTELKAELTTELKAALASKPWRDDLAATERRLSAELAQHANAIMESNRATMIAILDPYVSLPARVDKLEAAVFAPKPKRRRAAR